MCGLGVGVNGEVGLVADDGRVGAGSGTGDRFRDAKLFDVLADDFLAVDPVDGVLAHTEEEWRHVWDNIGEVDEDEEAQVMVLRGEALTRD